MPLTSTISHEIAAVLRDEILRQQFRSGERLPSERDLAARFNASRGAVREALSQIEQLGLIRILPGGARVQGIDAASIAILGPLMALDPIPDPVLVDQFLQTFGALSSLTARNAILKASREQLIHLHELVVNLVANSSNFETMQPQWRELLETLSNIADNLVVRLIGNDLKAQFVEQMMKLGIKPDPGNASTQAMLTALDQAITKRDAELAGAAMQTYFDTIRRAVCAAIEQMSPAMPRVAMQ
jgi:GntR family transcriptional repressor for pyruvate dehydrogenase complex